VASGLHRCCPHRDSPLTAITCSHAITGPTLISLGCSTVHTPRRHRASSAFVLLSFHSCLPCRCCTRRSPCPTTPTLPATYHSPCHRGLTTCQLFCFRRAYGDKRAATCRSVFSILSRCLRRRFCSCHGSACVTAGWRVALPRLPADDAVLLRSFVPPQEDSARGHLPGISYVCCRQTAYTLRRCTTSRPVALLRTAS